MRMYLKWTAATLLGAAWPAITAAQEVVLGAPVVAENAAAPAKDPAPVAPPVAVPVSDIPVTNFISPRWSLRRDFGDGVGYDNGYTYLEGFAPFLRGDRSLAFANVRLVNYDQSQYWEAQAGGGGRWMLPNVVAGLNAFYDGRNTNLHYYNQAGFGWELLGRTWEARGNFYVPVGQQQFLIGQSGLSNIRFVTTHIAGSRNFFYQSSAGGLDVEVGRQLPSMTEYTRTLAYLGYYHYDNDRIQSTNGVRGRLETWIGENVSLHLSLQSDNVNDTTVTGGFALHYGGVRKGFRRDDPLAAKLGSRVVRDPNIVLQNTTVSRDELLIDPATGKPFEVRHANSSAPTGGDGSVEHPYQTLGQLQAGSGPQQILFLHANSVFNGQNIVLQNNQRLLGEGIDHGIVATQGAFLLPRATAGTVLPIIQNSQGIAAVTLASNTEVAGLQILSPNISGIYGDGVANVNINRNIIRDVRAEAEVESAAGIFLNNVTGTNFIRNNTITTTVDNFMTGINLNYDGANRSTLFITGNTLSSSTSMNGIQLIAGDTSNITGYINRNSFAIADGYSGSALFLIQAGSSTGLYQVALNQFGNGDVTMFSTSNATLNLQLANNTASSFDLSRFNSSVFNVEDLLGTNTPLPTTFGVTVVPAGTFGFPPP